MTGKVLYETKGTVRREVVRMALVRFLPQAAATAIFRQPGTPPESPGPSAVQRVCAGAT